MANVSKHDTEQEGEGYRCKISWVYFFVSWYPIGVDNVLKDCCEIIGLNHCWWFNSSLR